VGRQVGWLVVPFQHKYGYIRDKSFVFGGLPETNRACLVGVYAVTLDPLLSLYGIIYVTWYTRLLPKATSQIPVAFGIPDHVTYQTRPVRFW